MTKVYLPSIQNETSIGAQGDSSPNAALFVEAWMETLPIERRKMSKRCRARYHFTTCRVAYFRVDLGAVAYEGNSRGNT